MLCKTEFKVLRKKSGCEAFHSNSPGTNEIKDLLISMDFEI